MKRLAAILIFLWLLAGCASQTKAPEPDVGKPSIPPEQSQPVPATQTDPPQPVPDRRQLLWDPQRTDLAICVAVSPEAGAEPAVVATKVTEALKALSRKPAWSRRGFDTIPNRVVSGCPAEPYLMRPGVRHPQVDPVAPTPFVEKPSPYLVFLFVLPEADVNRAFAGVTGRTAFEEYVREGDVVNPMTIGLYLTASDLNPERLEWGLSQALLL